MRDVKSRRPFSLSTKVALLIGAAFIALAVTVVVFREALQIQYHVLRLRWDREYFQDLVGSSQCVLVFPRGMVPPPSIKDDLDRFKTDPSFEMPIEGSPEEQLETIALRRLLGTPEGKQRFHDIFTPDLRNTVPASCNLHGAPTIDDEVAVWSSLTGIRPDEQEARHSRFPLANSHLFAGRFGPFEEFALIRFCPRCREAEAEWLLGHSQSRSMGIEEPPLGALPPCPFDSPRRLLPYFLQAPVEVPHLL